MAENILLGYDLGTTALAGRLATSAGRILAEAETDNPQKIFGNDVIRRLEASREGHAEELQALLGDGINGLTAELLKQAGQEESSIAAAAAAARRALCRSAVRRNRGRARSGAPGIRHRSAETA